MDIELDPFMIILIAPRIPPGHEQFVGELDVRRYARYGGYSRYFQAPQLQIRKLEASLRIAMQAYFPAIHPQICKLEASLWTISGQRPRT